MSRYNFAPTFKTFEIAPDASGVVALAVCAGLTFSCTWIGKATIRLLDTSSSAPGSVCHRASASIERAFTAAVRERTSDAWRAECAEMYA